MKCPDCTDGWYEGLNHREKCGTCGGTGEQKLAQCSIPAPDSWVSHGPFVVDSVVMPCEGIPAGTVYRVKLTDEQRRVLFDETGGDTPVPEKIDTPVVFQSGCSADLATVRCTCGLRFTLPAWKLTLIVSPPACHACGALLKDGTTDATRT